MRTLGTILATAGAALLLLCVLVPQHTVAVNLQAAESPLVPIYRL